MNKKLFWIECINEKPHISNKEFDLYWKGLLVSRFYALFLSSRFPIKTIFSLNHCVLSPLYTPGIPGFPFVTPDGSQETTKVWLHQAPDITGLIQPQHLRQHLKLKDNDHLVHSLPFTRHGVLLFFFSPKVPSIRCQVTQLLDSTANKLSFSLSLLHLYSPAQRNISLYIRLYISVVFFFYWV